MNDKTKPVEKQLPDGTPVQVVPGKSIVVPQPDVSMDKEFLTTKLEMTLNQISGMQKAIDSLQVTADNLQAQLDLIG